jgi:hypothetical protein
MSEVPLHTASSDSQGPVTPSLQPSAFLDLFPHLFSTQQNRVGRGAAGQVLCALRLRRERPTLQGYLAYTKPTPPRTLQ